MASRSRPLSPWIIAALTLGPAALIGSTLWFVSAGFSDGCTIAEQSRLASPDERFDLVVLVRSCADGTPTMVQADILPRGEVTSPDASSFLSVTTQGEVRARWIAQDALEVTLPPDSAAVQQETSANGVRVTYR